MRTFARRFFAGLRPTLLFKNCLFCLLMITLAFCLPAACSDDFGTISIDSTRTTIVFFGDSITAGYDVVPDQAFPALISEELIMPVINAGLPGDTTASALARLERDHVLCRHKDILAGTRVTGLPGCASLDLEDAEVPKFDPPVSDQGVYDGVEGLLNDLLGLQLSQPDLFGNGPNDLFLGHDSILLSEGAVAGSGWDLAGRQFTLQV